MNSKLIFDNNLYINKNIDIYIKQLNNCLPFLDENIIKKIISYYSINELKKNNLLINRNFIDDYDYIYSYYSELTKKFIDKLNIGMNELRIFDSKRSNWMLYDEVKDLERDLEDTDFYTIINSLRYKIDWIIDILQIYIKDKHLYDQENLFELYLAPNNYKYKYFQDIYLTMKFNKFLNYQKTFNKDILLILQSYLIDEFLFLDIKLNTFNNNKIKNIYSKILRLNNITS
jgi:hypothetical protein